MALILPTFHNPPAWFEEFEKVNIDRVSLLALVISVQFSLLKGNLKPETERILRNVGGAFAQVLLERGLVIGSETKETWSRLFRIRIH